MIDDEEELTAEDALMIERIKSELKHKRMTCRRQKRKMARFEKCN